MSCSTLLAKNFRSYTRWEILAHLLLPVVMLHLIWIRSGSNQENMAKCFIRRNSSLGDIVNLNPLYNTMEDISHTGPDKILLLHTKNEKIERPLANALASSLKLMKVISVTSEEEMERMLIDGYYLGGIIWQDTDEDIDITIRFPSVLRMIPLEMWDTSEDKNDDKSKELIYWKEGFLQVMYALVNFINYGYLREPYGSDNDNKISIISEPFIFDKKTQDEVTKFLLDPMSMKIRDILPFYLSTFYIYPFICFLMHMIRERDLQLKELMRISKASRFLQYFSWFLSSFIILTLLNFITVFLLKAPLVRHGNILNCSSFTAIFFFFELWAFAGICFCFLAYSFIKNIVLAVIFVLLICIFSFLMFRYVDANFVILNVIFQLGFLSGMEKIFYYEFIDITGLHWWNYINFPGLMVFENLFDFHKIDYLWFTLIPLVMFLGAILCLILCVIGELCCPGRYGIRAFRKRLCGGAPFKDIHNSCPAASPAVVQTNRLGKVQRGKANLRNFSMNMYDDQITVILGLSDSGKSSIINAISGCIPPSSGWATIDGKDIVTKTKTARKSLGLAPQHDALFGGLTVQQHLYFFSALKRRSGRSKDVDKYISALQLYQVRNVKSRNLSPADKRKLAVACAFCGNSRIILLDEPGEKMDPCERRLLWEFLQKEKRCRTIIVTTYHIEEADILGDRIAIICDGELIFNGTSTYLKNTYGSGYQLVCSQGEVCPEPQVTSIVLKYVPDTKASSEKPSEVSYNIPKSNFAAITPLIQNLEDASYVLNVGCIGIGTTPILSKFVNATSSIKCPGQGHIYCGSPAPDERLLRGCKLCQNQWKAMFLKKLFHLKHHRILFLSLLAILPTAFLVLHDFFHEWPIPLIYYTDPSRGLMSEDPLKLSPSFYENNCKIGLVTSPLLEPLKKQLKKEAPNCSLEDISSSSIRKNRESMNKDYICALDINKCDIKVYFSQKRKHSEAIAAAMIGFLANTASFNRLCSNTDRNKIRIPRKNVNFIHHPYMAHLYTPNATHQKIECFESGYLYLLLICLSIFSGFFAAFIIRERMIGFKLLQQVEGINMGTFWLAHLLFDAFWLSVLSMILLLVMALMIGKSFDEEIVGYIMTLVLFSLALLPFLYVLMHFFKWTLAAWVLPTILLLALAIPFEFAFPDIPFGFLYLIPTFSALSALHSVCIHAWSYKVCKETNYIGCDYHEELFSFFPALKYILMLVFAAIVFFFILLLCERGFICRRSRKRDGWGKDECGRSLTRNEAKNHTLVLDNAKTTYMKNDIKGISFALKPMDVLGLVGERSGKTTLNKVIVAEKRLSGGHVFVKGMDLHAYRKSKFKAYKYMGYCPQRDGFEPNFTGSENLQIFCLIRGIRPSKVKEVAEELADNLNFAEHLNKPAKAYTVSNRRKLSIAIAIIGTPPLILLDEPTEGLEKAHRTDVLDVLKSVNESGSSILLSSKNAEDFQSLCNKLVLLRRGVAESVGSVESFKTHGVRGLILLIKIRPYALQRKRTDPIFYSEEASINNITAFMMANFQSVYLLEKNQGDVLYYIHHTTMPLAEVFKMIEANRENLNISDFYCKQENLELTFILFSANPKRVLSFIS